MALNQLQQSQHLAALGLKGYKNLLLKLRQCEADKAFATPASSPTSLQEARARVLASLQSRKEVGHRSKAIFRALFLLAEAHGYLLVKSTKLLKVFERLSHEC
jgi:hypothetical protein